MDFEKRLEDLEKKNAELKKEVEYLNFRIGLVASKTHVNQILYEYDVNQIQYNAIMDVMDDVRKELDAHRKYDHATFEQRIKEIFPDRDDPRYDYHFAEDIARAFMEDGRWEEVFPSLYGNVPKFKYYLENMRNEGK